MIQRFKAALPTGYYPGNPEDLVRDPHGDFVKYADFADLTAENERLRKALKHLIRHSGMIFDDYAEDEEELAPQMKAAWKRIADRFGLGEDI